MNCLLLDQGLPRSAVQHLEERGFDVRHVADIGHSRASDADITALAVPTKNLVPIDLVDFSWTCAVASKG